MWPSQNFNVGRTKQIPAVDEEDIKPHFKSGAKTVARNSPTHPLVAELDPNIIVTNPSALLNWLLLELHSEILLIFFLMTCYMLRGLLANTLPASTSRIEDPL